MPSAVSQKNRRSQQSAASVLSPQLSPKSDIEVREQPGLFGSLQNLERKKPMPTYSDYGHEHQSTALKLFGDVPEITIEFIIVISLPFIFQMYLLNGSQFFISSSD